MTNLRDFIVHGLYILVNTTTFVCMLGWGMGSYTDQWSHKQHFVTYIYLLQVCYNSIHKTDCRGCRRPTVPCSLLLFLLSGLFLLLFFNQTLFSRKVVIFCQNFYKNEKRVCMYRTVLRKSPFDVCTLYYCIAISEH